jgi:thymidine phosphorylase
VQSLKAESIGIASTLLGAGRENKDSLVDPAVGIVLEKKIGDPVEKGETLAVLHVNSEGQLDRVQEMVAGSFQIGEEGVEPPPLIHGMVVE